MPTDILPRPGVALERFEVFEIHYIICALGHNDIDIISYLPIQAHGGPEQLDQH